MFYLCFIVHPIEIQTIDVIKKTTNLQTHFLKYIFKNIKNITSSLPNIFICVYMYYLSDKDIEVVARSITLFIKHSYSAFQSVSEYILHYLLYIQQQTVNGVHDVAYSPYQDVCV